MNVSELKWLLSNPEIEDTMLVVVDGKLVNDTEVSMASPNNYPRCDHSISREHVRAFRLNSVTIPNCEFCEQEARERGEA